MFNRVLLAVDGSEGTALPVAADVAWRYGAEVLVLHVREHGVASGHVIDVESTREADEMVDELVRDLKDAGVSARGEVVRAPFGLTARAILDVAAQEGVDLIVVGNPGPVRGGRLQLGHVGRKVAHRSPVPVLVVR
jgi:nucleotide-binding universal stress UspA family protein